ncbi:MAG: asparaginase [Patescibacteria group bacterium]
MITKKMVENVSEETIAFITTGGTIGAALGDGVVTLENDIGAAKLRQFVTDFVEKNGLDLRVFSSLNKFSEDFEPADWGAIFEQIDECLKSGIKRVVIAHGTDTLAYSAFATSLYYNDSGARICFTAAFTPPSDAGSDAFLNIEGALEAVQTDALHPGVYVAFRKNFFEVAVYRAQDLKPIAFDHTQFDSVYGRTAARYTYDSIAGTAVPGGIVEITNIAAPNMSGNEPHPSVRDLKTLKCRVIQIPAYPGMDLATLNLEAGKENLIILESFHSGTIPAVALRSQIRDLSKRAPKTLVVSAPHPYRYIKNPYETTAALERDGFIRVYRDLLPYQLYTLAVCETAKGESLKNALARAEPWRFRRFE